MAIASFQLDPAATALEDAPKTIRNETGSSLVADDLVYITGWDETNTAFLVTKADADIAGGFARLVMRATLATATNGEAFRTFRSAADNVTDTATVGDPVYLDTVAGGWTLTAPVSASAFQQIVGRVAVVHLTAGVIEFDLVEAAAVETIGSNEIKTDAITSAKIVADAVTDAELSGTAAKDNLDALGDTSRGYIKTNPTTGEFPIISIHREADGDLDIEYDDVAV